MERIIHIQLLSDAVFGNGMSMPGGEDICILTDEKGFPYMKGSTLKGIFREELVNYLEWTEKSEEEAAQIVKRLMGESGSGGQAQDGMMTFSDLMLHRQVMDAVNKEDVSKQEVLEMFSYTRDFTALENGLAREGSLRRGRCIKKGLNFYAVCNYEQADEELVKDVFALIKWIGSMRNRGFGKVAVKVEEDK